MTYQEPVRRPTPPPTQFERHVRWEAGRSVPNGAILVILTLMTVWLGACNRESIEEAMTLATPAMAPTSESPAATPAPTSMPPTATSMATARATETATIPATIAPPATATVAAPPEPEAEPAVVTVQGELNVRGGPDTSFPVIGAATVGQEFPITGQNGEGDWWQIDFDGEFGWLYAPYVTATHAENVPVVASEPMQSPSVTVNGDMNVRDGPGTDFAIIGTATFGDEFPITGQNEIGDWWQIDYSGQTGWIYGPFVTPANAESVPVVSGAMAPASSTAPALAEPVVTVSGDMNVRGGPGTNYPVVGAATAGDEFPIIGRNEGGDWWQIDFSGQTGWMYAPYVTATNAENVPVATVIPAPPPTDTPTPTPTPEPAASDPDFRG